MWQQWDPDDVLNNDFAGTGASESAGDASESTAGGEGDDQPAEEVRC